MEEEELVGLVTVVVLLLLVATIIILFSVFLKRKNKLIEQQAKTKEAFQRELAETQIEIREETLRNISWELHDNIGQLMTLAKIQAQMAIERPELLEEVAETLGKGIQELRTLSKMINPEAIRALRLEEAVRIEIERFNRVNYIASSLEIKGTPFEIDKNNQIILFRILQESFTNTIKHSKATQLKVLLEFGVQAINILVTDNGIGFSSDTIADGIGLKNMRNRAELIKANLHIRSMPGKGTELQLTYHNK